MRIEDFLDATYLRTPEQEGISQTEYDDVVQRFLTGALSQHYKAVVIRPEYIGTARKLFLQNRAKVLVGTVVDFPYGTAESSCKLEQIRKAVEEGADELDVVLNYEAFKKGETAKVREEVMICTEFCLMHHKTIKWIIEVSALTDDEIIKLTALIKNTVIRNFKETDFARVFIKSSTGVFKKEDGKTAGATPHALILMLENATPLPVKASGGIRDLDEVLFYISKGVKRIGTSVPEELVNKYYR